MAHFIPEAPTGASGSVLGFFGTFVLVIYLVAMAWGAFVYILQAVGMYTVAKRRGISSAWLAWVPVGSAWIFGSISDHYQKVVQGRNRKMRRILLLLAIISTLISAVISLCSSLVATARSMGADYVDVLTGAYSAVIIMAGVLTVVIALLTTIFQYIALVDYYRSCSPRTAIPFMILSVMFGFLMPFFIFGVRKKDEGMGDAPMCPPEHTAQAVQPAYQPAPYQTYQPAPGQVYQPAPDQTYHPEQIAQSQNDSQ